MTIDSTDDRIGRRMNMFFGTYGAGVLTAWPRPRTPTASTAFTESGCHALATTGEPARTRWMLSTMTWSPGLQPLLDDPVGADPAAGHHVARPGGVAHDDVDELASERLLHGRLRHEHGVVAGGAEEARAHELAGQDAPLGVAELGAQPERARRLVDAQVGEVDAALLVERAAVGEHQLHPVAAVLRRRDPPRADLVVVLEPVVVRDGEVHEDGVELVDRRQEHRRAPAPAPRRAARRRRCVRRSRPRSWCDPGRHWPCPARPRCRRGWPPRVS